MSALIPCIVAGGSGTRLWPVSREARPKPFMRLPDGESLLQKTFLRASRLPGVERVLTVTNRELVFGTRDDYREVNPRHLPLDFLLEPCGRNTAPAIAVAALHAQREYGDDAQLLILPADHLIGDEAAFAAAVQQARALAAAGYLATFGIRPTQAETGYGYIEAGEALAHHARLILQQQALLKGELRDFASGARGTLHLYAGTAALTVAARLVVTLMLRRIELVKESQPLQQQLGRSPGNDIFIKIKIIHIGAFPQ